MSVKISIPSPNCFGEIAEFVKGVEALVPHQPHFYKIIEEYFGDTFLIAEDSDGKIVGFTFGFQSSKEPDLFFLWQIGVSPDVRRENVGARLVEELENLAKMKNCKRFRATVLVENIPSRSMFEKLGFQNASYIIDGAKKRGDLSYLFDYYGEGNEIILYERDL